MVFGSYDRDEDRMSTLLSSGSNISESGPETGRFVDPCGHSDRGRTGGRTSPCRPCF